MGRMRALLVVVSLAGCIPSPVYRVQRSARVPRLAAPLRSGEPLRGPIELAVSGTAGNHGDLVSHDAAIEVPSQQMRGELRMRIGRGEISPFYEQAIESSIESLDSTQAPVDHDAPYAVGVATRYSFATSSPGLSIGTSFEVMNWSLPYVEYRTCIDNCLGVSGTKRYSGTEEMMLAGFGLTPTYRSGPLAVFAGAYTRRHPTIVRKGQEVGPEDDRDTDPGHYNLLVHAGIEYDASYVSLIANIAQDLTADPVRYGPSVGLGLAVHVPDRWP